MKTQDQDKTDCVIARCGGCKRVVYAAVNEPQVIASAGHIKEIYELVRKGCTVEHMPVFNVRKSDFGCRCHAKT